MFFKPQNVSKEAISEIIDSSSEKGHTFASLDIPHRILSLSNSKCTIAKKTLLLNPLQTYLC